MSRQEEKKAEAEKLLTRVLEECLDEDLSFCASGTGNRKKPHLFRIV